MPVVVAVHGTGRNVGALRDGLIPFADRHDLIVVTPLFPCGIDDPDDVHNYKTVEAHGRDDLAAMGITGRSRPELSRLADNLRANGAAVRHVHVAGVGHSAAGTQPTILDFFTEMRSRIRHQP